MPIYSYEIGEEFSATGQATSSAASKAVVGNGSSFESEFAAGYLIIISGETRVVDAVTDDTHLSVTENFTTGSGGDVSFTGANLVNLESLSTAVNPPRSSFKEYSQRVGLGDGKIRGLGWATANWRWGFLSQAERNKLRTFCTGASNRVYIRTRKNDSSDAYNYYEAVMVWGEEERDHSIRLDFELVFRDLSLVEVS